MQIAPCELERYFIHHEFAAPYLLCSSNCESIAVSDLLALEADAVEQLHGLWLGYMKTQGDPALRAEITTLCKNMAPDHFLANYPPH